VSQLSYADYQAAPGASANLASTGLRIDNDFAGDKLVINELMYDPSGGDNSTNPEFVEIYNNSNAALDIGGYYFQYGSNPEYAFPNGTTIDANDFLVVVYNKTLFLDKFPGFPNAKLVEHDPFSTASVMANSGTGTVYLRASDFATVLDTVAYRVTPPWPGNTISGSGYAAQNTGYSIELFNPNEDNSDGQNWFVSSKLGGTPGAHDFLLEGTRNLENPTPSDEVKLVARTGFVPPVAGSVKASYSIDNGATQTVTLQPDGNGYFSYSLGMLPDRTYVSYVIEAQSSADNVVYQASNDMLSFIVTSQAPFENNDIIITEIMYNPAGGDNGSAAADRSEWIEYYNRRSTATNIGGMLLGTERANLIKVPEGVMVAPYSYFLLVGNLTKFQQQYPSVTVPMIDAGWTVSKLANSGTSARLIVIPPNQVNIRQANVAIDGVVYQVNAGKWPADVSNSTIQLLDIALDNNAPESWTRPAGSGGTPGAQNTNSSGVADWSVY